jgi:hypothetical protein
MNFSNQIDKLYNNTFSPANSSNNLTITAIPGKLTPLVPPTAGYVCLLGSSVLWAGIYLPVRQYEVGDGFFLQFIIFLGSWSASFIVNCIRNFPPFKVFNYFNSNFH